MSYDLAVWIGPTPPSAAAADAEYARRMDAMEEALDGDGEPEPPAPQIRAFVEAALERYPEIDNDLEDSVWASTPLLDEAVGDLIYVVMTFSGAEHALDDLVEIATSLGLVCYDPQAEEALRPAG